MTSVSDKSIDVFLVDDHKCVLWGLEKLIEGEQPRQRVVGKASNRESALSGVRATAPDVVLLDLHLDGVSSLDFLPQLREQSNAQVLILTGANDRDLLERSMILGASGIVLKNESADVIVRAIEHVHQGQFWVERSIMTRVLNAPDRKAENPLQAKIESLTKKENQIVSAIVKQRGAKGEAIAAGLFISEHTLRNHLTAIYRKLDLRNRVELVMFALEHKLTSAGKASNAFDASSMR